MGVSIGYSLVRGRFESLFVESLDSSAAKTELGTTEHFDSQTAVIKSLSKQSAGIAASVCK